MKSLRTLLSSFLAFVVSIANTAANKLDHAIDDGFRLGKIKENWRFLWYVSEPTAKMAEAATKQSWYALFRLPDAVISETVIVIARQSAVRDGDLETNPHAKALFDSIANGTPVAKAIEAYKLVCTDYFKHGDYVAADPSIPAKAAEAPKPLSADDLKKIEEKIKRDPTAIKDYPNPDLGIQMLAVGYIRRLVKTFNEDHDVERESRNSINRALEALRYIENPAEAVQIEAVSARKILRSHGGYGSGTEKVISYIKNPSEAVQLAAVESEPLAIQYIKDPSEQVQLAAVTRNGRVIQYLSDPSPAVIRAAAEEPAKSEAAYLQAVEDEIRSRAIRRAQERANLESYQQKDLMQRQASAVAAAQKKEEEQRWAEYMSMNGM